MDAEVQAAVEKSSGSRNKWATGAYNKEPKNVNKLIDHGLNVPKPTGGSDRQNEYARHIKEVIAKEVVGKTLVRREVFDSSVNSKVLADALRENKNNIKELTDSYKKSFNTNMNGPKFNAYVKERGISKAEGWKRLAADPRKQDRGRIYILKSKNSQDVIDVYKSLRENERWFK